MNSQQSLRNRPSQILAAVVAGLAVFPLALALRVGATPYATALTNSAGIISFRLNESADGVKVISSGGAVTNDLGPLPQGLTVTNLGISGVYKVQVSKAGSAGWQSGVTNQISVDTNNFVKFVNQRGVAVNKNTNSPYFGRIYVSVATAGTVASNEFNLGPRTVGEGFYLLNADQTDALGEGDTARTAGLVFDSDGTTGTESPYRLFVGPDDNLFISDWSATNGALFVTDPNVATNSFATNVLDGIGGPFPVTSSRIHGSIASCWVEGSVGVNLTVYAQDEDLQTDRETTDPTERNSVWLYNIGSGTLPYTSLPTKYLSYGTLGAFSQVSKIDRGPDGKWYGSNRRADNATTAGIFVLSSDGMTNLWNSLSAWRTFTGDPAAFDVHFSEMRGFAVSPDGRYLVGFKANTNAAKILPLESGVPNITNLITMPTTPTTSIGRDICFDAVGNLYTVSSGQQMLRIYSPGGNSVVTTGSDGTLTILQLPEVTVQATTPVATEAGPVNGVFTLTRGGGTADPLTVGYNIVGTATNGVDYTAISDSVTFLPGQNTTNVSIVPVDDSIAEFTETVTFSLNLSNTYNLGSPSSATLAIVDNETPELSITNLHTQMFERTNDYARYQITRRGNTNAATFTVNLSFTGSATSGTDFYADAVTIDPGNVTKAFQIYALDDSLVETNETVICSLAAAGGGEYTIGSPSTAGTVTIVNATLPPEEVLFSDNFDTDTTGNWTLRFGSTNGFDDYTFAFNYDYSFDSIPSAPHSTNGTTRGLKMTVNKLDSTPLGAAGINFYPNGQNFSGDYALRFDMYLIDAGGNNATEGALFGINHSGTKTNWFRLSGGGPPPGLTFDGLFFDVLADNQSSVNSYALWSLPLTGNNPTKQTFTSFTGLTGIFKAPPWAVAGLPSNLIPSTNSIWADVEASQINNVVALKVNGTQILSYTNTGGTTSGNIMIGYVDPFDSVGLSSSAIIYDNVRVVRAFQYRVTSVVKSGGSILIDFNHPDTAEPASAFKLQSSTTADGPYADISATITQTGIGTYHVVASAPDNATYYRIKRLF